MPGLVQDQPKPEKQQGAPVWGLVIEDMKRRDAVGRERYGTPLQANNGRNALVDAYQECLDQAVYLRQRIEEDATEKQSGYPVSIVEAFRSLQHAIHHNAKLHGWWDDPREGGTCIALMHSELSECVEALRNGNPPDKHCPTFSNAEIELADVVIRILDFCGRMDWNLGKAVVAKHDFNKTRPMKHGGKLF